MENQNNIDLMEKAKNSGDILRMLYTSQSGHPGGSLSCVEILLSLYYRVMSTPKPQDGKQDRIVLSKGHACPALYAATDKGFFPREDLWTLAR